MEDVQSGDMKKAEVHNIREVFVVVCCIQLQYQIYVHNTTDLE
jgi:hypothetical protein